MRRPARLTRRLFLAGAVGAGGSVALARIRPWGALVRTVHTSPAMRLVSILGHPESARAVGRVYLASSSFDASPDRLVDQITVDLPRRSTVGEASDIELRNLLATRIQADFSEGLIVEVDGWILSCTEARLCALAVLV